MAVAFIQGASRGIGLEFARVLSARSDTRVVAGCRDPDGSYELQKLPNVSIVRCDVTKENDLVSVSEEIQRSHGKLDFAINVSGILHPSGRGETKLGDVSLAGLEQTFAVNAFGPMMMAKHFSPLLQKGGGLIGSPSEKKQHAGVLAHISARVGSIQDNRLGGWYSYRMSKAALNMANRTLSLELGRSKRKSVVCVCLHPGTTDTDLSKPYTKGVSEQGKLFTTQYSVVKMMEVVDRLSMEDTGKFFAWDGKEIPY